LWGGEIWTDGYYVGTVGERGNWEVVKEYVRKQGRSEKDLRQLELFKKFFLLWVGVGGSHCQSRIGERESFIFPAFSLVRVSRKETLKEFETAINMAPRKWLRENSF